MRKYPVDHTNEDLVDLFEDISFVEYRGMMFRELIALFGDGGDDDEMLDFLTHEAEMSEGAAADLLEELCASLGIEPTIETTAAISAEGVELVEVLVYPPFDHFYLDGQE